jgi:hypothetical protein
MNDHWQPNADGSEHKAPNMDLPTRVGQDKDDAETTYQGKPESVDQRMSGPKSSSKRSTQRADKETQRGQNEQRGRRHRGRHFPHLASRSPEVDPMTVEIPLRDRSTYPPFSTSAAKSLNKASLLHIPVQPQRVVLHPLPTRHTVTPP